MGLFGPTGGGGGVTSVNSQTGAVTLTAKDVTATPLYFTYIQHQPNPTGNPLSWTLPVANVAGFYNDLRLQGFYSSSTTIELRIPRITPNEALVFGYECLFCCELADKTAIGQQFPPIIVRDDSNNSIIYSRPGNANPNISFSIYLRKEFATGWVLVPFPSDVQAKSDKNEPSGYAGLNSSGKVALAQLDATTSGEASATLPSPQVVLGSDTRLKPFACFRPANWSRGSAGAVSISVPTSANFVVGETITITGSTRTTGSGANIDGTHVVTSVFGTPASSVAFTQQGETTATGTSGILLRRGIVGSPLLKPDWNAASGQPDEILNKPSIPAAQVSSDWNAATGIAQILNKPSTFPAFRNVFGPMVIQRFGNWNRGQSGYVPGDNSQGIPPSGMFAINGNVVENFNQTPQFPRLFNAGQFFGVGRSYKIICAVRCSGIVADGVHMQLRWFNGITSQIISGLMDFGGGNDGFASKAYWSTSDTLTAADEWWVFTPYAGAYNGDSFASIQDVVVLAYLT